MGAFEEHFDGRYARPLGHPKAGDALRITVQVYLHDVPETHGGATTFFPRTDYSVRHQPEVGSVLLFTQDLLHRAPWWKRASNTPSARKLCIRHLLCREEGSSRKHEQEQQSPALPIKACQRHSISC